MLFFYIPKHCISFHYKVTCFISSDTSFKVKCDNSKSTLTTPSSSSDDIVSTPFSGRKPPATSNKAIPTPCTGPVLVALPAPPPGTTDIAQHVKETLKVNVSEFHVVD